MTVVHVARSYLGTHTGAPVVSRWLAGVGIKVAAAWCLAASIGWHVEADPHTRLPRLGRCSLFWARTRGNSFRFETFTPQDVSWGIATPAPGDVAIFSHNPNVQDWAGHAATVVEALDRQRVRTIEGNTSPNDKGDQRMGGVVAEKVRRSGVRGFWLMGFVRERHG